MSRCQACRRPLTNPVSLQYGMGPDCLKRAAQAGQAPLDALTELQAWQRTHRPARRKPEPAPHSHDSATPDLFAQARRAAIDTLKAAAAECAALGVAVNLTIEGEA